MTLQDHLLRRIGSDGPISVADYMAEALLHAQFGYYATQDPFGQSGDFITAPEISQMFGELIGLSLAQAWMDQGAPSQFTLAELGPGRGTLMRDILRVTAKIPGFEPQIVLVEASEKLQAVQRDTLEGYSATWITRVEDLPDRPLFLIANEFFDALPIRQFQRNADGWREIRIGKDGDRLSFGLGQRQGHPALSHRLDDTRDGDIVEHCPALPTIVSELSARIAKHGGAALVIDYGDWRSLGNTLQAVLGHERADPLVSPGAADLTAHVDFETVANAARPAKYTRLTSQGVFLERLGITARAQALAQNLSGSALETHISAHRRLTHPDEMGALFKVMGLYPESHDPPPGLEP